MSRSRGDGGWRDSFSGGGDRGGSRGGFRGGDRGGSRGGDRGGSRGGDRGGFRGGDRGGFRGGDRGGFRGGDRGGFRGGDRGGFRGGDRGGFSGGDRGGFRGGRGGGRGRGSTQESSINENVPMAASEQMKIIKPPKGNQLKGVTIGRPVDLIANFYQTIIKDMVVYQYDLDINKVGLPEDLKDKWLKRDGREIYQHLLDNEPLLKGKQCYTDYKKNLYVIHNQLALGKNAEICFEFGNRKEKIKISIKETAVVDLGNINKYYANKLNSVSEAEIHALNILVNFTIDKIYAPYGRSFFDSKGETVVARSNPTFSFARGFMNSIRLTQCGLSMNLHLKTAIMLTPSFKTILEFLQSKYDNVSKMDKNDCYYASKDIKGLKIFTTHVKGRRIALVAKKILEQTPFDMTISINNKNVTVADYYKKTYNIQVERYPLVECSKKDCFLPMELCHLKDTQFFSNQKADMKLQNDQLFFATVKPNVYFDFAGKYVKKIGENKALKDFGVEQKHTPMQFTGRVLPKVDMKTGARSALYSTGKISKWMGINLDPYLSHDFDRLAGELEEAAKKRGLLMPGYMNAKTLNLDVSTQTEAKFAKLFEMIASQINPNFILVSIPSRTKGDLSPADIYRLVKVYCDQRFGIPTQCIKSDNVSRTPRGYADNLLLKVNGKLGGSNRVVDVSKLNSPLKSDTMVVGMDVNHPGVGTTLQASISSAVGTFDPNFSKFTASIKVQDKNRTEIINKADEMVKELLEQYKLNNSGKLPRNMFIFRDGVSEGQFDIVKKEEIPLIRKIIEPLKILLTFVVVQKRHHTRFVLKNPEVAGKNLSHNVPAGTVVDNSIVEPDQDVFYLNSHFSPLGTSKPSKYIVLVNDLKLSMNDISTFANYNCQTCSRTEKSISLPAPVKYADLCAYRAKAHLEVRETFGIHAEKSKDERMRDFIAEYNRKVKISPKLQNLLYYC